MRTQFNKKNYNKEWIIEHWYEKVLVTLGIGYGFLFILLFSIGFVEGLMNK